MKADKPHINECFLRSDNAGCYHNAPIELCLRDLGDRVGVTVRRNDYSEACSGKDICDRKIAPLKAHMYRYLNEGHDPQTASDMKKALDAYGGVKGCYVAVVEVNESKQQITSHKWRGIQALHNFQFSPEGIRVWQAFNVGPGKMIKNKELKSYSCSQGATTLTVVVPFSEPKESSGPLFRKPRKPHSANVTDGF